MGVLMDSLPSDKREEMEKQLSDPEPEECNHVRDQYVTDGQRFCNTCDTQIERDGEGGFQEFTDGRHDEAYGGEE